MLEKELKQVLDASCSSGKIFSESTKTCITGVSTAFEGTIVHGNMGFKMCQFRGLTWDLYRESCLEKCLKPTHEFIEKYHKCFMKT